MTHLFTEIISACRALEDAFSVACLGPKGTFSEEAVVKHFGSQTPATLCGSIDEVFRAVEAGSVGYGVVPVENSTEGAVGRTLDNLLSTPLRICGEVVLPVHQNLLSRAATIAAVMRIYSHAQSLAQCSRWLNQNCPRAELVPVASNAEAARMAVESRCRGHRRPLGGRTLRPAGAGRKYRGRTEQHHPVRRDLQAGGAAVRQ